MTTQCHSFIDADARRCGAILRRMKPGVLTTRTVFRMGDDAPMYLVDHAVEHAGRARQWTRFRYDSPPSRVEHVGTRAPHGAITVDGVPAPDLSGAVPGYAEHLMVHELLAGPHESLEYHHFHESAPEEGRHISTLRRGGTETIELADGSRVEAERIRLSVDGTDTNVHWCVDGVVVRSDWCGAQSDLVEDIPQLLAGLDSEVVISITDWLGSTGPGSAG